MVKDTVETDDAVAFFAFVIDRAALALLEVSRGAPPSLDVVRDDCEVLVAEEEPAEGALVAQTLDRHYRIHHRLREGDAAALVTLVERDVLVIRRRRVADPVSAERGAPGPAAVVHPDAFAREADCHAAGRPGDRAVLLVVLDVAADIPVNPVDVAVRAQAGRSAVGVDRVADRADHLGSTAVVPARPLLHGLGDLYAHGAALEPVGQLIDPLAAALIAGLPGGPEIGSTFRRRLLVVVRLVVVDRAVDRAAREGRTLLLVQHVGAFLPGAHEFAPRGLVLGILLQLLDLGGIEGDPLAVVLPVELQVIGQVLRLTGEAHAEDGLLRALGHAHILVTPVRDVHVVDLARVFHAARLPGGGQGLAVAAHVALRQGAGRAVDRLVQLPVGVAEVIQRHVAGGIQHRPALGIGQLVEAEVSVRALDLGVVATRTVGRTHGSDLELFVASVRPVDDGQVRQAGQPGVVVQVVHALDQGL